MRLFFIIIVCLFNLSSFAQKEADFLHATDSISLQKALKIIEKNYEVKFSFSSTLIENKKVKLPIANDIALDDLLFEIGLQTQLDFYKLDNTYIYIEKSKAQVLQQVLVNGYIAKGINKHKDGSYHFTPQSLGLLAGMIEPDILESIQQLPGVMSISETATRLNVRGGTADQNQVVWDDINIYHSGHLFGLVSVFNPNVAQKIIFYNKATPVRFDDRISSVIDIRTLDKIPEKTNFQIGINGISADMYLHQAILKEKLVLQASFRRSYEDFIETPTFASYEDKAFQNAVINDEFFYFKDYNISLNYKISARQKIKFSYIHIDNDFVSEYEQDDIEKTDELDSENDGYSLRWQYHKSDNTAWTAGLSASNYRFDYANIVQNDDDDNIANQYISKFTKNNYIDDYQFFTEFSSKLSTSKKWFAGYQFNHKRVSYLFKEDKDLLYILDADNRKLSTHSLYSSFQMSSLSHFSFILGARINYFDELNTFRLAPRLIINHKVNKKIALQFSAEVKNQSISQIEETVLNDFRLENRIWRLSDGDKFPIISAKHFSLGAKYKLPKYYIDFDIYHKTIEGLSALTLGFLNPVDNQYHQGVQKINGIEILVKRKFNHVNTWLSYAFVDSKNKYEQINNGQYFDANTQIKHSLSFNLAYTEKDFQATANWQIRSGKPLTILSYDQNNKAYVSEINTATHPAYHRLDFSASYQFKISKKIKAKTAFSIRNVYNNKSLLNTEFYGNNSVNDSIKSQEIYAIGITSNFMFRLYW